MKDISSKYPTYRTAKAATSIQMDPATLKMIQERKVPKGDVFEITRTAVFSGVKRCDELVPFCHSVPLDWVEVRFEYAGDHTVNIFTEIRAVYHTGVEIEALLAAQLAAINLYDLLKPIDEHLEIGPTQLLEKTGGHSQFAEKMVPPLKAAILVASDSTAAGKREDRSGVAIRERMGKEGVSVVTLDILPDQVSEIEAWVRHQCLNQVDLIFTTGGSGLGPRDCTVEAVKRVIDREVPGIAESIRWHGRSRTPYAMLSRGVAGTFGKTLIITLPGSSRGVKESLDGLFPGVLHAFKMMSGGGH